MPFEFTIPGVYHETLPRPAPLPLPRTDVVGFAGFERRVRDGSTPCALTGDPIAGHSFHVDVLSFQVRIDGVRFTVPATTDLLLSTSETMIPMATGETMVYAIAAAVSGTTVDLVVVAGPPTTVVRPPAPSDDLVRTMCGGRPFLRLVDVAIRRSGDQVFPVIIPRLGPQRCDDWMNFELAYGLLGDFDGTFLAPAVRAFFINGGARCWVTTVRRPRRDDVDGLSRALEDMIGLAGSSEREATGLERLLLITEIAVLDMPDLYARRVDPDDVVTELPPRDVDACFRRCDLVTPLDLAAAAGERVGLEPLFSDAQVRDAQRRMIVRIAPERWRVQLLLTAPVEFDSFEGRFGGPTADRAEAWRKSLDGAVDDETMACVAFYYPWLLGQERVGGPIVEMPPTPYAAGVIARRDLARGPHISPANETVRGVVALTRPIDDATHGRLYDTPNHVNVIRPFPGYGIQVWGARTLSTHETLRYLSARRCLSAIERRVDAAFRVMVFEPNTPGLWFQLTHIVIGILAPIFQAGALAGDSPDQAFFVRCDQTNNPADQVAEGRVLCEVGVALAIPAEFIVFRLSRSEAAVEVEEAAA